MEQVLADLALQEKRLVDLYTVGGIAGAMVREKNADLSERRKVIESQLSSVHDLKIAGHSDRAIARILDVDVSTAHRDVKNVLEAPIGPRRRPPYRSRPGPAACAALDQG